MALDIRARFIDLEDAAEDILARRAAACRPAQAALNTARQQGQQTGQINMVHVEPLNAIGAEIRVWHKDMECFIGAFLDRCNSDIIGQGPRAPSSPALVTQHQQELRRRGHRLHVRLIRTIGDPACPLATYLGAQGTIKAFEHARKVRNGATGRLGSESGCKLEELEWAVNLFGAENLARSFRMILWTLGAAVEHSLLSTPSSSTTHPPSAGADTPPASDLLRR